MDQVKKNVALGISHETLWGFSWGLINPITVLQQGLADLGGDAKLAGMLAAFLFFSLNIPQLFSAFVFSPSWTGPKKLALMHLPAIAVLVFMAWFMRDSGGMDAALRMTAYIGGVCAYFLLVGMLLPHWIACQGRNIPDAILGRYFGAMFGLAGLAGIGGGVLAQRWISALGVEGGYSACFALAVPFELASIGLLAMTRPIGDAPSPAGRLKAFLQEQWSNIRHNRTFQTFGALAVCMQVTTASGMLYTAYLNTLGNAQSVVAWTTGFTYAGMVLGAILLGQLLDHRGPRWSLSLAFAVYLGGLIWIQSGASMFGSTGAFFGVGFFNACFPVVTTYLVLTLAQPGRQLAFTGLFNSLMAPWALAPIALGWLAEAYSYRAAFIVSALAGLAALGILAMARSFGAKKAVPA